MVIPSRFRERYAAVAGEGFFESLGRPLPQAFRVNTLKTTAVEVQRRFEGYGIPIRQVEWYADAFVSPQPVAGRTLEHFAGRIYLQELTSMLPPLLVADDLQRGRVLDACAAPGSKTTQCAALMGNRGLLVANDSDYRRIKALKFNCERQGVLNAVITNYELTSFPQTAFDVILLDAPCSAEGTIRKNPAVLGWWSEREILRRQSVQKRLLLKAFDLLSPGGVLVYSTCTMAPEENEAVVDALLREREAELESIAIPGIHLRSGLLEWGSRSFDPRLERTARVWPQDNDTGGFFLAKVRK